MQSDLQYVDAFEHIAYGIAMLRPFVCCLGMPVVHRDLTRLCTLYNTMHCHVNKRWRPVFTLAITELRKRSLLRS